MHGRKIIVLLAVPFLFILAFNQFRWLQEINTRSRIQSEEMIKQSMRRLTDAVHFEITFLPLNISRKGASKESFAGFLNFWLYNSDSPRVLTDFFCADKDFSVFYRWEGVDFHSFPSETDYDCILPNLFPQQDGPERGVIFVPCILSDRRNIYVITKASFPVPGDYCVFVFDRKAVKRNLFVREALKNFGQDFKYRIGIFDSTDGSLLYTNAGTTDADEFSQIRIPYSFFLTPSPVFTLSDSERKRHGIETPPVFVSESGNAEYIKFNPMPPEIIGKKNMNLQSFANLFPELQIADYLFQTTIKDQYVIGTVRNGFITAGIFILILLSFLVLANAERKAENLAIRQQEFIATITHELKTPIAVVSSAAQNLTEGIITDREKISEYGKLIKNEADRLSLSVNHYLMYAGMDQLSFWKRKTDLCSVREIILSVLNFYESERVKLGMVTEVSLPDETAPDGKLLVYGNALELQSAFGNIVLNAMRHAFSGKYLAVSAWLQKDFPAYPLKKRCVKPLSRVHKSSSCGFICVTFSDKGSGILEEEIKTIFEPFVRGREALRNQIPGNGIGLSLVAKVVTVHNGTIFIDTKKDSGTTFILVFPAADSLEGNFRKYETAAQNFNDRG